MNSRLDIFIDALIEALQPHGGCQCGCYLMVNGAVLVAREKLREADDEAMSVEADAENVIHDTYGSGE